jgi:hypothetical protein
MSYTKEEFSEIVKRFQDTRTAVPKDLRRLFEDNGVKLTTKGKIDQRQFFKGENLKPKPSLKLSDIKKTPVKPESEDEDEIIFTMKEKKEAPSVRSTKKKVYPEEVPVDDSDEEEAPHRRVNTKKKSPEKNEELEMLKKEIEGLKGTISGLSSSKPQQPHHDSEDQKLKKMEMLSKMLQFGERR